ncbi:MAG: hypothetical protein Q7K44_03580 [Candidatus Liptonbacteria bacterium]|nr:hypothetical protein [Candidatus Liptonbacteria bacterium]
MNDEHKKIEHHEHHLNNPEKQEKDYTLPISILMSALILAGAWIYTAGLKSGQAQPQTKSQTAANKLEEKIIPSAGVALPIKWGGLGAQMVKNGTIDYQKLEAIYAGRSGMGAEMKALLQKSDNGSITMTSQNSGEILNLLWAFGLANKNPILENGPMQDPQYGGAGNFASTGGWTIAVGDPMGHYSAHQMVMLTADQQALVESVSKNIYRPCCGNSVYFPDCNHGMAMLGLLELMASQGATEEQMYKTALGVNSYWFPDTYLTIARYMQNNGIDWNSISLKSILGASYSSAQGYARIQSLVIPEPSTRSQGGCDVDAGQTAQPQRQQSDCGVQ